MLILLLSVLLVNPPSAYVEQRAVDRLWSFTQHMTGVMEETPPVIEFARAEGALGYWYEGTNTIHVTPRAVEESGFHYVIIGHEMLHYLCRGYRYQAYLGARTVLLPVRMHHRYFAQEWNRVLARWVSRQPFAWPLVERLELMRRAAEEEEP